MAATVAEKIDEGGEAHAPRRSQSQIEGQQDRAPRGRVEEGLLTLPANVSIPVKDFNDLVRQLLDLAMAADPTVGGPALVAAYVLQARGYHMGPKEGMNPNLVPTINKCLALLQSEI